MDISAGFTPDYLLSFVGMSPALRYQISLRALNTFGIQATAFSLAEAHTVADVIELINAFPEHPPASWTILGGGSNVLFTRNVKGLVVLNRILGRKVLEETEEAVLVRFGAGEMWHDCVWWAVNNGMGGIENLALIPGTIGAAPMQNIGAYGVELRQVFHELEAVDLQTGEIRIFSHTECSFGYRESYFKQEGRNRYFIVSVTLKLVPEKHHHLSLEYGAIRDELATTGNGPYTIRSVAEAVIRIRRSKLPDPTVTGNAGSFFKNPEIPEAQYQQLKTIHPNIPAYPAGPGLKKIAAGWLIESAGWKGFRRGDAGVHDRQALVLVNHGNATGAEILALSEEIIQDIFNKFGIHLTREVNIL